LRMGMEISCRCQTKDNSASSECVEQAEELKESVAVEDVVVSIAPILDDITVYVGNSREGEYYVRIGGSVAGAALQDTIKISWMCFRKLTSESSIKRITDKRASMRRRRI